VLRMRGTTLAVIWLLMAMQPVGAQSARASEAREWLLKACGVGERAAAEALRSAGDALVPIFLNAFEQGPSRDDRESVRTAATRRFNQIAILLARGRDVGLNQANLEIARRIPLNEYVDQAVEDFVFLYRSEALRTLGTIGGETAVRILQRVARDAASPFAITARLTIADLRKQP